MLQNLTGQCKQSLHELAVDLDAVLSRVRFHPAVITVYTSVGGKPDLVKALIERATGAEVIQRAPDEIDASTSGWDAIRLLAHGHRMSFESDSAIIAVMQDAARHDQGIADAIDKVKALYRRRLDRVGAHLRDRRRCRSMPTICAPSYASTGGIPSS